ncbi:glycoside hydrolase family 2 [Flavobacterium zepuense]|uniref:Beta-galactosidase n=2 Tax=Flavobacterium zepuense TaxID=2593302 RepID=A0A552V0P3_9FLAO|nr:glycoside hydrolase family 2 [Flavobacterium zepuense]
MRFLLLLAFIITLGTPVTAQTKQVKYLSGTDNENTVAWDFWVTGGRNAGKWSTIQVPGHWEQQGFGAYNYGRDYTTYGKNFRFADEKGLYKHTFMVPDSWKGQKISIVFEGSMTDTEVKINGKSAGAIHQGSFYRFKYDITDKVQFGKENKLEVTVSKMSADQSVNNAERLADYWIFGGIFRPVYLEATPQTHITWTSIDAKADGSFKSNIYVEGIQKTGEVLVELKDKANKTVGSATVPLKAGDTLVKANISVKKPALWTAETPNLYHVHYTLKQSGKDIHKTNDRFGFRTIEVRKGDGIYVNGTKVKMKGVNRHVWWPETGRTINAKIDLMDVEIIKGMNMNAVRCSHYPPDKAFLQYCDSLGLYVLDELAGWQKAYSTKAGAPLVKEMVIRDCNHPSIIIWSNGNEGGHNFDLDDDYAQYDLSGRPVIHAHHKPGNAFGGIDCNHYENYYSSKKILEDENIYMVTEFLHAQDDGGGAASLADFWDLHWNSKKGAGGFIWALLDEGLVRTDYNGRIDTNGINAPDGILGPHREKEGCYNAIKKIYSPVKIDMAVLPDNFTGTIPVENRYHYTNINQCTLQWELVNFAKPGESVLGYTISQKGDIKAPDVKPTLKGNIKINLPKNWKDTDALLLRAIDPFGKELYTWTWKIKSNKDFVATLVKTPEKESAVAVQETDTAIELMAKEIVITISKKDGLLALVVTEKGKKISFTNGPVLVSGTAALQNIKTYKEGSNQVVECTYSGDMKKVLWKLKPNGWLELAYEYQAEGDFAYSGVSFNYPVSYVFSAKWLGNGQYRVWKNRMDGVTHNVWGNIMNTTQTGYAWTYPEFKGYYSDITWMEIDTAEGKFLMGTEQENLFVRLFDFYALSGPVPQPELPKGDISFLEAIPPIAGKLAFGINTDTASLGPLGELNKLHGTKKRTLHFYFGSPESNAKDVQFIMPSENILTD